MLRRVDPLPPGVPLRVDLLVAQALLRVRPRRLETRHPIDDVDGEAVAIDLVGDLQLGVGFGRLEFIRRHDDLGDVDLVEVPHDDDAFAGCLPGGHFALASLNGEIQIWQSASQQLVREPQFSGLVTAINQSPGGHLLVAGNNGLLAEIHLDGSPGRSLVRLAAGSWIIFDDAGRVLQTPRPLEQIEELVVQVEDADGRQVSLRYNDYETSPSTKFYGPVRYSVSNHAGTAEVGATVALTSNESTTALTGTGVLDSSSLSRVATGEQAGEIAKALRFIAEEEGEKADSLFAASMKALGIGFSLIVYGWLAWKIISFWVGYYGQVFDMMG